MLWHTFGVPNDRSGFLLSPCELQDSAQVLRLGSKHLSPQSHLLIFLSSVNGVLPVCISVYHVTVMPEEASRGLPTLWGGNEPQRDRHAGAGNDRSVQKEHPVLLAAEPFRLTRQEI